MSRKFIVVVGGLLLVLLMAAWSHAGPLFVATAKNARGALYQGFGPSPGCASEMAIVKCSQDSFIPPSCRVVCVRMECPPPVCLPPMHRPIHKTRISKVGPPGYAWGRPMP
ncbi:MAG: hypothetical protein WBG50_15680 [Desulfomonilaceae bacterium]